MAKKLDPKTISNKLNGKALRDAVKLVEAEDKKIDSKLGEFRAYKKGRDEKKSAIMAEAKENGVPTPVLREVLLTRKRIREQAERRKKMEPEQFDLLAQVPVTIMSEKADTKDAPERDEDEKPENVVELRK